MHADINIPVIKIVKFFKTWKVSSRKTYFLQNLSPNTFVKYRLLTHRLSKRQSMSQIYRPYLKSKFQKYNALLREVTAKQILVCPMALLIWLHCWMLCCSFSDNYRIKSGCWFTKPTKHQVKTTNSNQVLYIYKCKFQNTSKIQMKDFTKAIKKGKFTPLLNRLNFLSNLRHEKQQVSCTTIF